MRTEIRILAVVAVLLISVVAPALSIAALADENTHAQAQLEIKQPHYVGDDVTVETEDGQTIYIAEGEELAISPQNFDTDQVVNYGTDVAEFDLAQENGFDHYTLHSPGNGTVTLYWVVEEEVQVEDGNETVTETQTNRYEATVRVTGEDREYLEAGTLAQYQEDAESWQEWETSLQNQFGSGVDVESHTQAAFNLLRLRFQTFDYLTGGQMFVIAVMMLSVSGLILLGIDRIRELATIWPLAKSLNKRESLDSERKEMEEVMDEYTAAKRGQKLAKKKPADIFEDERTAVAISEAWGETCDDVWRNYNDSMRYWNLIHDRLQAFALCDYAVAISWDGDNEPSARLLKPDETANSDEWYVPLEETIKDENGREETVNHVETVMEIIDLSDDKIFEDKLSDLDFDRDKLLTRTEAPASLDEMIDLIDEDRQLFDDKEQYARAMLEFVEDVYYHPYTDNDGREDAIRAALSTFFKKSAFLGDRDLVPLAHLQRERLELALEIHDPVAESKSVLQNSEDGRYV